MFPPKSAPSETVPPQAGGAGAAQGDGLHHYQLDEDEGGGFHATMTGPDGQPQHADYATFDDAHAAMPACFGQGQGVDDGADAEPDMDIDDTDTGDIAGAYGRKAGK